MTPIRLILISACLALSGCNTTPTGSGGVFSSLGVPSLGKRDCPVLVEEAGALSARASVALDLPAAPVREGPEGTTVVPWPDPQSLGAAHEETVREMVAFRESAATSGCPLTFEPAGTAPPVAVAPLPTPAVEVLSELPPPAAPILEVAPPPVQPTYIAAPVPVAPVDLSIPMTRRSAWEDEPVPVGVAGMNPGNDPLRPETATGRRRAPPAAPAEAAAAPAPGRPPEGPAGARPARGQGGAAKANAPKPSAKPAARREASAEGVERAPSGAR